MQWLTKKEKNVILKTVLNIVITIEDWGFLVDAVKILAEAASNLARGRAIATGIGVFLVIIDEDGDILLRRRSETGSLYEDNLSGLWEPIGGGIDLLRFAQAEMQEPGIPRYRGPVLKTLDQELFEEAGLRINGVFPLVMIPAFHSREYESSDGEKRQTIDLAFSVPICMSVLETTGKFDDLLDRDELAFVSRNLLERVEIVSPRLRFLVEEALNAYDLIYQQRP